MTKSDKDVSALEARIDDLEQHVSHLHTVLIGILESMAIPEGSHYALLALAYRFTATDEERIEELLRWAYREQQRGTLTRDAMEARYSAEMPQHLQGKLEQIMKAYQADDAFPDVVRVFFENRS